MELRHYSSFDSALVGSAAACVAVVAAAVATVPWHPSPFGSQGFLWFDDAKPWESLPWLPWSKKETIRRRLYAIVVRQILRVSKFDWTEDDLG